MPAFLIVLLLFAAPSAHAYVDPGSGMLLLQGMIALIAGVIAFFRSPWRAIAKLWRRIRGRGDA